MDKIIYSQLYGKINHEDRDGELSWQLYQSRDLSRLRDISLSSVPARFLPQGQAASRFEHSVGVGYLARKICDRKPALDERRLELVAAALCHDIASPPFSHISEIFLWDQSGRTHEQDTERVLGRSEMREIFSLFAIDTQTVVDIINGKEPLLGPLLAGSIDLDNIDNSLHLMVSMGYHRHPYEPLDLLRAYSIQNNELLLQSKSLKDILGWQECRRDLYRILHEEANLSAASMLYRALESAYERGYIEQDFFMMGESRALEHLLRNCGKRCAKIIQRITVWRHYEMIHQQVSAHEDPRLASMYSDWRLRKKFTDRIAKDLGIPRGEIALYIGRDRGEKSIDLPFVGEGSYEISSFFQNRPGKQRLSIFASKEWLGLAGSRKLDKALDRAIADLPETDPQQTHVFF